MDDFLQKLKKVVRIVLYGPAISQPDCREAGPYQLPLIIIHTNFKTCKFYLVPHMMIWIAWKQNCNCFPEQLNFHTLKNCEPLQAIRNRNSLSEKVLRSNFLV